MIPLPPFHSSVLIKRLEESGRVIDMKGGSVSIQFLGETLYEVMRYRQAGEVGFHGPIDVITSDPVIADLRKAMRAYYSRLYAIKDFVMMPMKTLFGETDVYSFPSGVRCAIISCGKNDLPMLWMLYFPDLTEGFEIMTPKEHCLIRNFSGFEDLSTEGSSVVDHSVRR